MGLTQSEILYILICCFAVYLVSAFVQRVSGFGMGIMAIMLLPLFIPSYYMPASISGTMSALSCTYLAVRRRKNVKWQLILPVIVSSFVMTIFAVRFVKTASLDTLRIILGILLILMSLWFLFFNKKAVFQPSVGKGLLAGAVGGWISGMFATGGPPIVFYLLGTCGGYEAYFATVQLYFAVNGFYSSVTRIMNGMFTPEVLIGIAGAIPGVILGNVIGGRIAPHIPEKTFLRIVYAVMLLSGISMFVRV